MSEKKPRKKKNEEIYLIDFDIPQKNKKCRQKFYRKINKPEFKVDKSTKSVLLTSNKKKAKAINRKASSCGKSNIYRVKKLS
jgi:hypothetical protein